MNDEQLIWEIYMKSHEGDTGETPWNPQTLRLKDESFSSFTKEKLDEYLKLLIEKLREYRNSLEEKYGEVDRDDFIKWAKPDYITYSVDKSNEFLKTYFGFDSQKLYDFTISNPYDEKTNPDELFDYFYDMSRAIKLITSDIIRYNMLKNPNQNQ